jgi:fatty acid amide hydrolase
VAHPSGGCPPVPFHDPAGVEVAKLRVALVPQIGDWQPSPAIRRGLAEAAAALQSIGCAVEEWANAPDLGEGIDLFFRILGADGFDFQRQILGGERPVPLIKQDADLTRMPNWMLPVLGHALEAAGQKRAGRLVRKLSRLSGAGMMDLLGDRFRYEARFIRALDAGQFDAILCPAMPLPAVRHGDTPKLAGAAGSVMLFNVLGTPAGVVAITRVRPGEESDRPATRDGADRTARAAEQGSSGLPVGVQVVARHWREDVVLALMQALEAEFRARPDYPAAPPI